MPDPCIAETCSLTWETGVGESGPNHVGNVRIAATSSIECIDGQGLDVKVGGGLSKAPDGTILGTPGADVSSFPDVVWVDVPITATQVAPVSSAEQSLANPMGVDAICVIEGNLSFFYAVVGGLTHADISGLTPYNAQMLARVFARLDAAAYPVTASIAEYIDGISGMIETAGQPSTRQERGAEPRFSFPFEVPAGSTLHIQGRANYQGPDQRINTAFDGTSSGGQKRGFKLKDVTATWHAAG